MVKVKPDKKYKLKQAGLMADIHSPLYRLKMMMLTMLPMMPKIPVRVPRTTLFIINESVPAGAHVNSSLLSHGTVRSRVVTVDTDVHSSFTAPGDM